ncbi:MAG: Ada metal-binding domain-containing protein [Dehalococcoidia bacterium]|nr:Ada metal-binding domain-containing protein [Dehalococcoidia bacterium]
MKGKFSHLLMALILPLPLLLASCISWPFGGGAPTINSFTASPTTISAGSSSVLTWSVSDATALIIDQGIGSVSAAGSSTVTPVSTTTYTLTAVNASGSITASATVTVESGSSTTTTTSPTSSGPLPIAHIYVNPGNITPAGTAVLSWDTSNASNVVISNGIGPVSPSGSRTVSPNGTTVYVITAGNANGTVTASTQLAVGPTGTPANNWLASTYTHEYHWPSCSIAQHIPMPSRVWFNTVNQAQAAGYHPCPVCHPPR